MKLSRSFAALVTALEAKARLKFCDTLDDGSREERVMPSPALLGRRSRKTLFLPLALDLSGRPADEKVVSPDESIILADFGDTVGYVEPERPLSPFDNGVGGSGSNALPPLSSSPPPAPLPYQGFCDLVEGDVDGLPPPP